MADTPAAAPAASATSGSRASNNLIRGRRRGGGSSVNTNRATNNNNNNNSQQAREGRGGNRGRRGGRSRGRGDAHVEGGHDGEGGPPPDTGLQPDGTSGDRLAGDASDHKGEGREASADRARRKEVAAAKGLREEDSSDEDDEVCFICASKVVHRSVAPCKHWTCHICALRMRALYKTKACAHCRTESPYVVFTDSPVKTYSDFKESDFVRTDHGLGIHYDSQKIYEDTVLLLRYNCPDKKCDVACLGWADLHHHVKSRHGKQMCELCTKNKKVFTHEHELFTVNQLRKHEKFGDHVPGSADQSGFKGHPECGFCRTRFYGDDELYAHCRDKHERCHICDRRSNGRNPQYFVNYDALEEHFKKAHYLCLDKDCLEKKFVVFENQMDLKAHQLEEHPSSMSKDARRDARHVDLSAFDVRQAYQTERPRRGAGRGRDPNAEAIPVSSAQPMRRDELAYHRQMAIQSAQSVTSRTFGGQLTGGPSRAPPTSANRTPVQAPTPPQQPATTAPVQSPSTTAASTPSATPSLRDQARQLAHAGVVNRAAMMLKNDQSKLTQFKNKVSAYKARKLTPTQMVNELFTLFDTSPGDLGKLIKELAELYENDTLRLNLLKAWNDWRAVNEDYPALPGASGANSTGTGGARVLTLRSSAATGRTPAARSNSTSAFPPLPSSTATRPTTTRTASAATPARSGNSSTNLSASSSRSSSRAPQSHSSNAADAFPALPAAPKPNTLMAGLTRGTRRWDTPAPQQSAWANDSAPASGSEYEATEPGAAAGGKKGKGKKKQVLYHFG